MPNTAVNDSISDKPSCIAQSLSVAGHRSIAPRSTPAIAYKKRRTLCSLVPAPALTERPLYCLRQQFAVRHMCSNLSDLGAFPAALRVISSFDLPLALPNGNTLLAAIRNAMFYCVAQG